MNIEEHDKNEPFTARILDVMESSTKCAVNLLSKDSIDSESVMEIIARLSIIESRMLMFLACLHQDDIEDAVADIVTEDEIAFMSAAEAYILDVNRALEGVN